MNRNSSTSGKIASAITRSASKQTYYTILLLADHDRLQDAFRAYGYFRWLDDILDATDATSLQRNALLKRQQSILEACYLGKMPSDLSAEEGMLADLVRHDHEKDSGLQAYLRNMMDVMAFDVRRRGQTIPQAELVEYSRRLAVAVTEALYYFIGHNDPSPRHEARYSAVTAAHIVHMLRDTVEDAQAGYYNIPAEVLECRGISAIDVNSEAFRQWVCSRVQLARQYFRQARQCTAMVRNWRCRLAGFAYTARFEWMLGAIEQDHYCLRCSYPARKSLRAGLWMTWSTLKALFVLPALNFLPPKLATQPVQAKTDGSS